MTAFKESRYCEMDLLMQMEDGTLDPKWLAKAFIDYLPESELEEFMQAMYITTIDELDELSREQLA